MKFFIVFILIFSTWLISCHEKQKDEKQNIEALQSPPKQDSIIYTDNSYICFNAKETDFRYPTIKLGDSLHEILKHLDLKTSKKNTDTILGLNSPIIVAGKHGQVQILVFISLDNHARLKAFKSIFNYLGNKSQETFNEFGVIVYKKLMPCFWEGGFSIHNSLTIEHVGNGYKYRVRKNINHLHWQVVYESMVTKHS